MSRTTGARLADHGGAANLGELAAIARCDLGKDDVADVENALARGAHREIMLRGAHQQKVVLGAEFFAEAIKLGCEFIFAHAGSRAFEQVLVAALGDPGGVLRGFQLLGGANARQIARQFVRRLRQSAQRRLDAGHHAGAEQGQPNRQAARHGDVIVRDGACKLSCEVVGRNRVVGP